MPKNAKRLTNNSGLNVLKKKRENFALRDCEGSSEYIQVTGNHISRL